MCKVSKRKFQIFLRVQFAQGKQLDPLREAAGHYQQVLLATWTVRERSDNVTGYALPGVPAFNRLH